MQMSLKKIVVDHGCDGVLNRNALHKYSREARKALIDLVCCEGVNRKRISYLGLLVQKYSAKGSAGISQYKQDYELDTHDLFTSCSR